eukprot:GDKK01024710.1.p1 GENE.GDKK01024710.1~~GDKK01024710.1.p1  ORF type:complete len:459 (-),score=112.63 GDKK01024710.1:146-1522(-)
MSYRETRNFCEVLRTLGYPRLVSMESFKMPNFVLTAEIIEWLLRKYDSSIHIPDHIEKEQDRINFITRAVEVIGQKAKIKLNPRKLYNADGRAVQELLKFATFLYESLRASNSVLKNGDMDREILESKLSKRLEDVRALKTVPSEIVLTGQALITLLQSEMNNREFRDKAIAYLEQSSVDVSGTGQQKLMTDVQRLLTTDREDLKRLQEELRLLEADGQQARETYEREKEDTARTAKVLQQLMASRPAFWEEYDKIEEELEVVYSDWVEKLRNLDYLESELTSIMQAEEREASEFEKTLEKIRESICAQAWKQFRGGEDLGDGTEEFMMMGGGQMISSNNADRSGAARNRMGGMGGGMTDASGFNQQMSGGDVFNDDDCDIPDDLDSDDGDHGGYEHNSKHIAGNRGGRKGIMDDDIKTRRMVDDDRADFDDFPLSGAGGKFPAGLGGGNDSGSDDDF